MFLLIYSFIFWINIFDGYFTIKKMKIAIVKLSSLGDICHSAIVLQFIKKNTKAEIDWFVDERFAEVLNHQKEIANVIALPISRFNFKNFIFTFLQTIKTIKKYKKKYDVVIDLQGLIKSTIVAKLLGCKNTIGYDKKSAKESLLIFLYNQKIYAPSSFNTIQRYLKVTTEGLNLSSIDREEIENKKSFLDFSYEKLPQKLKQFNKSKRKKITLIIGSTSLNRIYPKENWMKFILLLDKKKYTFFIPWGNHEEYLFAQQISKFCRSQSYECIFLEKKINLNQLKMTIQNSDLVIGNDTGPSYIAWGMNKNLILLFGHTPKNRILLSKNQKLIKSSSKVNPKKLDKKDFSIREINPQQIVEEIKSLDLFF